MLKNNNKDYISEDEGAGYAAPLIDIISSVLLIILSIWIIFESLELKIPNGKVLTSPALLPVITASTLILMLLLLVFKASKKLKENEKFNFNIKIRNFIAPVIIGFYILCLNNLPFKYESNLSLFNSILNSFFLFTVILISLLLYIFWKPLLKYCLIISMIWTVFLCTLFNNLFYIPLPGI